MSEYVKHIAYLSQPWYNIPEVMKMEKKLPKRKPIRLTKFDYSTVGAYFVTVCTRDRMKVLSEIVPVGDGAHDVPQIQLSTIGKIVEKHLLSSNRISGVKIEQYVIMPDHIHAIINLNPKEYIKNVVGTYNTQKNGTSRAPSPTNQMLPHVISAFKKFCNKEIGYNIFQRGYYDHVIRNKNDYDEIVKYIHDNPQKWYYEKR